MTVRSDSLALGQMSSAGPTTVYTVPAGYKTIVKHVCGENRSAGSASLALLVKRGATTYVLKTFSGVGSAVDYEWAISQVWLVLEAGDELQLSTGAASPYFTYFISGAELEL